MLATPAATAVDIGTPLEATKRTASALGDAKLWSQQATRMASTSRPSLLRGSSPVSSRYTTSPNERLAVSSSIEYPRTRISLGDTREIDVFQKSVKPASPPEYRQICRRRKHRPRATLQFCRVRIRDCLRQSRRRDR